MREVIKTVKITAYGRVVQLEQIAHHNSFGDVYVLSHGDHLNGWTYGRGHTEAKVSFTCKERFQKMADSYIETLARSNSDIIIK